MAATVFTEKEIQFFNELLGLQSPRGWKAEAVKEKLHQVWHQEDQVEEAFELAVARKQWLSGEDIMAVLHHESAPADLEYVATHLFRPFIHESNTSDIVGAALLILSSIAIGIVATSLVG